MSGNFTQRGEPALFSKWERAKIAVDCGIDLILELPFIYACNSAENFAKGAVRILNGLNCVDCISFGSESGDLEKLKSAAMVITSETPEFRKSIKENLDKGFSFPKARAMAVKISAGGEAAQLLESPNNILAAEYLKQLYLTKSAIVPFTVKRTGQAHNSLSPASGYASAAAIRKILEEAGDAALIKDYVTEECLESINKLNHDINKKLNNYFMLISSKILTERVENLEEILSAGEGLGGKILKVIRDSNHTESLISKIKSKRYTRTRIQRLLTHVLFDLKKEDFANLDEGEAVYARVLAFNDAGAALLKKIKKSGPGVPVITNINKQAKENPKILPVLRYDTAASDIYNLITGVDIRENSDFIISPYRMNRLK